MQEVMDIYFTAAKAQIVDNVIVAITILML